MLSRKASLLHNTLKVRAIELQQQKYSNFHSGQDSEGTVGTDLTKLEGWPILKILPSLYYNIRLKSQRNRTWLKPIFCQEWQINYIWVNNHYYLLYNSKFWFTSLIGWAVLQECWYLTIMALGYCVHHIKIRFLIRTSYYDSANKIISRQDKW